MEGVRYANRIPCVCTGKFKFRYSDDAITLSLQGVFRWGRDGI